MAQSWSRTSSRALAFIHIMETARQVLARTGHYPAHQVHDELIFIVDEKEAEEVMNIVVEEMSVPPWWMPNLPLAAEGHIGRSYGDAKG